MTNVTLMCIATAANGSPANVTSYYWNCYNNSHGADDPCFYGNNLTSQSITVNNLLAKNAGTMNCTATINGINYTSDPLTLRISGELSKYIHFS